MEIAFFWIVFAIIVGVAANTRGRDGAGWFFLAILISPLLAGLLVLALPRRERTLPPEAQDRREGVFRPDGMIEKTPYRVLPNGEAEAIMQGGIVRLQSLDHLCSMLNVKRPDGATERSVLDFRDGGPSGDLHSVIEGVRYKINNDDTVTAKTPIGISTYENWDVFLRALKTKSWWPRG